MVHSPIEIVREILVKDTANPATTTLNGAITATDTTITLTSGTGFTDATNFVVKCGTELIVVTRDGVTLTAEAGRRGAFGTTAAIHADGATIEEATLYDVTGTRWYYGVHEEDNDSPAGVLQTRDEGPAAEADVFTPDFTTRVFGGSESWVDVKMVHRMVWDRLDSVDGESVASGVMIRAWQTGGGQEMIDPDVEWKYIVGFWEAMTR